MTREQVRQQIETQAFVWWALHAPLGELSQRELADAMLLVHELVAGPEIDRLTARVAELELPQEKWPVVDDRDGYLIGKCPLCCSESVIGDSPCAL